MSSSNGHKTLKLSYDCSKCPAYCCSYENIGVSKVDLKRLARHFAVDADTAVSRYTRMHEGEHVLLHQPDATYGSVCMFLDTTTRRCTIYDARPGVCRDYPAARRCGYYDFLRWERTHQGDPEFVPLKRG